jgi:hypothetical protein
MQRYSRSCLILCTLSVTGALPLDAQDIQKAASVFVESLEQASGLLREAKDAPSAKVIKAQLQVIENRVGLSEVLKTFRNLNDLRIEELATRYDRASEELNSQYKRISARSDLMSVLFETYPIQIVENTRARQSLVMVKFVETAVIRFKNISGDFPADLSELTAKREGDLPVIAASMLFDAWGRAIKYDKTGIRNRRSKPDIWSEGSPFQRLPESARIGNWSSDKN